MKYSAINIQGNILTSDVLERIRHEDIRYQAPADFGLDKQTPLRDEIGIAWAAAKAHWQAFSLRRERLAADATGTSQTRQSWMLPFLRELGYDLEKSTLEVVNNKSYAISHRAVNRGRFPVHIVGINQSLDVRAAVGGTRLSPHALAQEYLNNHSQLYALVTNGRSLRLLRDATRLSRISYLEFDLERMMQEDLFAEFALLFRVLHVTRMPQDEDSGDEALIEYYHQDALASGSRIRERLSEAVEDSLKTLANGLLCHPANDALRRSVNEGRLSADEYYLHLLRLVYRILFLLVIEERNLVYAPHTLTQTPSPKSSPRERGLKLPSPSGRGVRGEGKRKMYFRFYSISRLTKLAEKRIYVDPRKTDLWRSLLTTFRLFENGYYGAYLDIKPLGSGLFAPNALGEFVNQHLENKILLTVLFRLVTFENEQKQRVRVNYADLDVEEFGSMYEGLLEYDAAFQEIGGQPTFAFVKGEARSSSGSHYTPEELVKPLIEHSLEHLIQERVNEPEKFVPSAVHTPSPFSPLTPGPSPKGRGEQESPLQERVNESEKFAPSAVHTSSPFSPLTPGPSPKGRGEQESPLPLGEDLGEGGEDLGEGKKPGGGPQDGGSNYHAGELNVPEGLLVHARELRKNQTPAEEFLWQLLRGRQLHGRKFRRQHPIGQCILDFYCHEERLAIELDGDIHNQPRQKVIDAEKEHFLKVQGIRILRFWNDDVVTNTPRILETITKSFLNPAIPSPQPLSQRTRGFCSHLPLGEGSGVREKEAGYKRRILQERALLSLKVADVAAGSGHILLSAARRIGLELARVRSHEDQPSPPVIRQAVRDVIRHCIYGVDKNPLAVELCKVALWLEAHNPGEPLNFLDHRIKCGDAIVGLAHKEELRHGIANEAFKKLPGDEKEVTSELSKRNRKERKTREQFRLNFEGVVEEPLEKILAEWQQVDAMPERTPDEIEAKRSAYDRLMGGEQWWKLKILADIRTAQFFLPKTAENNALLVTDADYREYLNGTKSLRGNRAAATAEALAVQERFFHYFLQFPEVFAQGGFDCVLGNPPFLGSYRISGLYGNSYLNYLHVQYEGMKGQADYVGYFFRRIFLLLREKGFQSLISTNTISQGDTREGSLAIIQKHGGDINFAIRSMRWPGLAAVEVAIIAIHKGQWTGNIVLEGKNVHQITSYLDDSEYLGKPHQLRQNKNKGFKGSMILGTGFILSPEKAQILIGKNPKNEEVLFPYLSGDNLNNNPEQSPTRWVINFQDWREEYCRSNYPECLEILERLVKPERQNNNDKRARDLWWQFNRSRKELYSTITPLTKVLVITSHTKNLVTAFTSSDLIYSNAIFVFALEQNFEFAIFSSAFHEYWAWKNCSTMGSSTLRYAISAAFETFPFPQNLTPKKEAELEQIGEEYHEFRRQVMLTLQLGLTKLYNQFHNRDLRPLTETELAECRDMKKAAFVTRFGKQTWELWQHLQKLPSPLAPLPKGEGSQNPSPPGRGVKGEGSQSPSPPGRGVGVRVFNEAVIDIQHLRRLHKEMDEAVLRAYLECGSSAFAGAQVELAHDFYDVEYLSENDRVRYTIHPDARKDILKRLLLLNHEIYAQEVAQGLHNKKNGKKTSAPSGRSRATSASTPSESELQTELF